MNYEALALDLFARVEAAVFEIAHLAVDTGLAFSVDEVVAKVERGLPADYPAPTAGTTTREEMIRRMAVDILSGDAYTDEPAR